MFEMFAVPWDFFHIGLLILVIMILITGMVICVSVIGVCCFHWLEGNTGSNQRNGCEQRRNNAQNSCQYDHQNQAVHVVVIPEKMKSGVTMDPTQLRDHFQRMELENSHRRFLFEERSHHQPNELNITLPELPDDGPPPYDALYPATSSVLVTTTSSSPLARTK